MTMFIIQTNIYFKNLPSKVNLHTSSIIWIKQVIFGKIYVCMYVCKYIETHAITINEKEVMNINDSRERYMGGFEGRKGKGKVAILL